MQQHKYKTIYTKDNQILLVDLDMQPVNGYYYDTYINKVRNTHKAEYGICEHVWQIIAAYPLIEGVYEFDTLPPYKQVFDLKDIDLAIDFGFLQNTKQGHINLIERHRFLEYLSQGEFEFVVHTSSLHINSQKKTFPVIENNKIKGVWQKTQI